MTISQFEVEFKYHANGISGHDFLTFFKSLGSGKIRNLYAVSGYDYFYSKKNSNEFMRYREDENYTFSELTFKKKTSDNNSVVRIEFDLPLKIGANSADELRNSVQGLCLAMGFVEDATIHKTAQIVDLGDVILSLYRVNHKDSFLEIEANKNGNFSNKKALSLIKAMEKKLADYGFYINEKVRVNESLFDLYRKKELLYEELNKSNNIDDCLI